MFFFQAVDPLLETLQCFSNTITKKPVMYLTQELRDSEIQKKLWKKFYNKLTDLFIVEQIPEEEQHKNYRSSDILLLRIKKKSY